jgi:hypothetical protein
MDDDKQNKDVEGDLDGESISASFDDGDVFQPTRIRHHPILSCLLDRGFMESKSRFVLYFGTLLWVIFLIEKTI